jgi:CelD/BcsL family acetyltransferase involved in cellulose biosynthesis
MSSLPGPPADVWDELARQAGNVFATRDWAECWWRHYGEGSEVRLLTVPASPDDPTATPHAFLALAASGRLLRRLRLVGAGPADQLGIIGPPSRVEEVLEELRGFLSGRPGHDVFLSHDVPVAEGWAERLGGTVLRREPSPVVHLPHATWDEFLAARSRNFREQARRKERKLYRSFDVTVRLADEDTFAADLETLFDLHRRRWGTDAPFATGRERRFQEAFAATALAAGRLRLWILELDRRPVAALHGFRFADAEYFHQSGRDPSFDEHSIGFLLLAHAIRAALEDGMSEYRLLRGDESYKARFADGQADVCTVAVPLTLRGRIAVRAASSRNRAGDRASEPRRQE